MCMDFELATTCHARALLYILLVMSQASPVPVNREFIPIIQELW